MRLPHAAKVLSTQVRAEKKNAKIEAGLPDGLGVYRTLRFDKRTSAWLAPLVAALADRRIASAEMSEGYLLVTFVSTRHADSRTPFALEAAKTVTSVQKRIHNGSHREAAVEGTGVEAAGDS